jgi:hypothetical protein
MHYWTTVQNLNRQQEFCSDFLYILVNGHDLSHSHTHRLSFCVAGTWPSATSHSWEHTTAPSSRSPYRLSRTSRTP